MNLSRTLRFALISSTLSWSALAAVSDSELVSLRTRAEAGDPIAQHNLGLVYADAKDPHFNLVESYAWLKTASQNGAGSNAFAVVKGQLSAAQLIEADGRAAQLAKLVVADAGPGPIGPDAGTLPPLEPASSTAEFKKYSEELSAVWKENEQLKNELGRLRAAAANFEGERNGLLAQVAAAKTSATSAPELDAAKKQLAEVQSELTKAREQAKSREAALTAEAEQARRSAADREKTLLAEVAAAKAATASAPAASDAVKAAAEQAEQAQIKLESALRSLDLQKKETDRAQKALLAVEAERAGLATQLAEARQAVPSAPTGVTGAGDADALRTQLAQAEARVRELEAAGTTGGAAPTGELAEVQDKLKITLRSFQLQREEIDQLKEKIAQLESEKSTTETRLADVSGQVSSAESKAAATEQLQRELALVREQLRHTQNQLTAEVNERMRVRDQSGGGLAAKPAGGTLLFTPQRPGAALAAPAPTPIPEPAAEPAAREYTVRPGDTLSKIARRMLGDADRWPEILEANRDVIANPTAIPVGVKLRIP